MGSRSEWLFIFCRQYVAYPHPQHCQRYKSLPPSEEQVFIDLLAAQMSSTDTMGLSLRMVRLVAVKRSR